MTRSTSTRTSTAHTLAFEYAPEGAITWNAYWRTYDLTLANPSGHGTKQVSLTGESRGRIRHHLTAFNHPRWDGDTQADRVIGHVAHNPASANPTGQLPTWTHDCDECVYLGSYTVEVGQGDTRTVRECDAYVCDHWALTFIARFGVDGEYHSVPESVCVGYRVQDTSHPTLGIAIALGQRHVAMARTYRAAHRASA